jgi:hypothetical protein
MVLHLQIGLNIIVVGFWFTYKTIRVTDECLAEHLVEYTNKIRWYRRLVIENNSIV